MEHVVAKTDKVCDTTDSLACEIDRLGEKIKIIETKVKESEAKRKKENSFMTKFNFGTCENDNVRMSIYGLAIKNLAGDWVSYDATNSQKIVEVNDFCFEGGKYLHNRVPMFVDTVDEAKGNFIVIDIREGEIKNIMPTQSPFGFNYITKVVNLFESFTNKPNAEQPFGNLMPFMLMNKDNKDGKDLDPMMLMMLNNQGNMDFTENPLMMYMLMKDSKFDLLPYLMMMNSENKIKPEHKCNCHKKK